MSLSETGPTQQFIEDELYAAHASSFKPPNDEEVFVTRETEKAKKKEAKQMLKHQRIWEKNTATSRAPLRRVRDQDISAAESEEVMANFNGQQRGYITAAMHIARSRVQFPRDQRAQNMQEFVDQKKEMFHAELANRTVQQEITFLTEKQHDRHKALELSQQELNMDELDLMNFINSDNQEKLDQERKEK